MTPHERAEARLFSSWEQRLRDADRRERRRRRIGHIAFLIFAVMSAIVTIVGLINIAEAVRGWLR